MAGFAKGVNVMKPLVRLCSLLFIKAVGKVF